MKKVLSWLWKHKIITLIVIIIIAGGGYYGYKKTSQTQESENQIKTATAEKGNINITVTGSGQVSAKNQVDLQPQVAGDGLDVIEIKVKNDQEVTEGQVIAVLDSTASQQQIESAKLQLRSAQLKMKQVEKENDTKTYDDKLIRQLQETAVAQQQISLNNAYEDLEDYTIKAPFDGIVTGLSVEAGGSISRDEILASVITKEVQATVTLNEVDAAKVEKGDKVALTFDALDEITTTGEVSKVDTIGEVDQGVVSYEVEIDFESPSEYLKPGMSVNAEIEIESKENILMVPSTAVQFRQNKSIVMVVDDDLDNNTEGQSQKLSFKPVDVETGISDDIYTEITSGLDEGDVIIASQIQRLGSSSSSSSSNSSSSSLIPTMGGGRPPQ